MSGERRPRSRHRREGQPGRVRPTARDVALDVLLAVSRDDAYANLLLPHRLRDAGLSAQDAGLATELTYGSLRWQGYYDAVIELAAKRPIADIDDLARVALHLGAHQVLGMRVPTHAAVNETVTAVRNRAGKGPAGFVNANVRRITEADAETWRERVAATATDDLDRLALLNAHPKWIARALGEALAAESARDELEDALASNNVSPRVQLAALPGLAERSALVAAQPDLLRIDSASPVALQLTGGDPADLAEVRAGTARVQDAGSQLVALALTRVVPLAAGERVLDLCAGPGGKSALLAAEALRADAEFSANEVVPARAKLVRDALVGVPGNSELAVTVRDGREFAHEPDQYDRILLDAPCTGLGALRRRPEARWRKLPADVAELSGLQDELLAAALIALKPGGVLAYVTCSPHPNETVAVVNRALRRGNVKPLDARSVCQRLAPDLDIRGVAIGAGVAVQLWPHLHGTDAMFLALLQKTAE